MILPEVLIGQMRFGRVDKVQKLMKKTVNKLSAQQTAMTVNLLATMAISFATAMAGLLVLATSSVTQAIVGGVLAMAAGFINLLREPPSEQDNNS